MAKKGLSFLNSIFHNFSQKTFNINGMRYVFGFIPGVLFYLAFYTTVSAQRLPDNTYVPDSATIIAMKEVKKFREGALILRLASKKNKADAYEKILANPNLKPSGKKKLELEYQGLIEERDQFNKDLVECFYDNFTFAKLYITYDTSTHLILDSKKRGLGVFLDRDLNIDPKIILTESEVFFTRIGRTDIEDTSGIIAVIIQDKNFEDLSPPFPYNIRLYSLLNQMLTVFSNNEKVFEKSLEKRIAKWEGRLFSFLGFANKYDNAED